MDFMTSNSLLMLEQSMSFLWTKQTAILENLSNVETPGYKTKYVTFEEALQARLKAANSATQKKASRKAAFFWVALLAAFKRAWRASSKVTYLVL